MVKKLVAGVLLSGALVVGVPGVASAEPQRPVYSQDDAKAQNGWGEYEEEYCPIERQYKTYQYRPNGKSFTAVTCGPERKSLGTFWPEPKWWNPLTWYAGVLY